MTNTNTARADNHHDNDGVTHINIWAHSKDELGRLLSHFAHTPFIHPYFGPFSSIEGFWHYIKSTDRNDNLRSLSGNKAKKYGRSLSDRYCDNFKEIIAEANWHKIDQNEHIKKMLIESTLPFDHYYVFTPGNILITPKGHNWLISSFEKNRELFKNGQKPDVVLYDLPNKMGK